MKVNKVQQYLDSLTDIEFWLFMRKPTRERMRILKRKVGK